MGMYKMHDKQTFFSITVFWNVTPYGYPFAELQGDNGTHLPIYTVFHRHSNIIVRITNLPNSSLSFLRLVEAQGKLNHFLSPRLTIQGPCPTLTQNCNFT